MPTDAPDQPVHPEPLDEAWAEAEAALPEGWHMLALQDTTGETWSLATWRAMAGEYEIDGPFCASVGPTPAAALHAIAVRLREASEPEPPLTDAAIAEQRWQARHAQPVHPEPLDVEMMDHTLDALGANYLIDARLSGAAVIAEYARLREASEPEGAKE